MCTVSLKQSQAPVSYQGSTYVCFPRDALGKSQQAFASNPRPCSHTVPQHRGVLSYTPRERKLGGGGAVLLVLALGPVVLNWLDHSMIQQGVGSVMCLTLWESWH